VHRFVTSMCLAAFAVVACGGGTSGSVATANVAALNASGVSGTATISDVAGGKLSVAVTVSDGGNPDMPSHLHSGTCDAVGDVVYPLSNVKGGTSTTEVTATAAEVKELIVVVHKSAEEIAVYTACGPVN